MRRFKKYQPLLERATKAQKSGEGWRKKSEGKAYAFLPEPPSHEELEQIWMQDRVALEIK